MSGRFVRRPQTLWWRRALFQVHLWAGIAIGLYVVLISFTGSALVFRRELDKLLCPRIVHVRAQGPRLSNGQIAADARAAYPRLTRLARVVVRGARAPDLAVEVWYEFRQRRLERLFDPYTGRNLGDTVACEPRAITALAGLHDELLGGGWGLMLNGAGALLLTLMCLSGAVLWWPGRARWRRSLTVHRGVGWRRFTWDLHSMLGFWLLLLVTMWAFTGIYLAFPDPFNALAELFTHNDTPTSTSRALNAAIDWMARVHFGRTFGLPVKVLWVVLGVAPAVLFVTGAIMWCNRVLARRIGRSGEPLPAGSPSRASAADSAARADAPALLAAPRPARRASRA